MLVPLTVAMNLPMLKRRLIMFFAKEPLCESQMSIQTTAMSDFGDTLMTQGFEANTTSLNRWVSLKTPSMKLGEITS